MVHVTVFIHHHHHHYACPSLCMNDDRRRASRMEAERERERDNVSVLEPQASHSRLAAWGEPGSTPAAHPAVWKASCFFPSSLERCSPQGSAVALEMNAAEQACLRVGLLSHPWLKIIIFHHTGENWIHVFNNTDNSQSERFFFTGSVWLDNVTYFTDKAGTWISHTGNQTSAFLP